MKLQEIKQTLFKKAPKGWFPQMGFAGSNKVAKLWLPGRKATSASYANSVARGCSVYGLSQLAFQSPLDSMVGQKVLVCWIGIDIDAKDNPGIDLTAEKQLWEGATMARTSCGGKGLHLFYRLDKPVEAVYGSHQSIVKTLASPMVKRIYDLGIVVDKADGRLFWVVGGKNSTIYLADDAELLVPEDLAEKLTVTNRGLCGIINFDNPEGFNGGLVEGGKVSGSVAELALALGLAPRQQRVSMYLGDIVPRLRALGEVVETKSTMRGNGEVNCVMTVAADSLELFSFTDSSIIWNFDDITKELSL